MYRSHCLRGAGRAALVGLALGSFTASSGATLKGASNHSRSAQSAPSGEREVASRSDMGSTPESVQGLSARTHNLLSSPEPINVHEFGAQGDGIHDDTEAFRSALEAARKPTKEGWVGNVVSIPRGQYLLTGTLSIEGICGMHIVGAGIHTTQLIWKTPEASESVLGGSLEPTAMFDFRDVANSSLRELTIVVEGTHPLPVGVQVQHVGNDLVQSAQMSFRDIEIRGGNAGVERGFRFARGTVVEEHNNGHSLHNVSVSGYLDAAFSMEHREVGEVSFRNCRFNGGGRGLSGVATNRGECVNEPGYINCAGSFDWYGGGGGGNRRADFDLGEAEDIVSIRDAEFRNSARFLHTKGPSGAHWPILIEGCIWSDDLLGEMPDSMWPLAEQMRIINFEFKGPLTLRGNIFGSEITAANDTKPSEIVWNPGGNTGEFILEGNYWATSKDSPFSSTTVSGSSIGIYPTLHRNNLVQRNYGGSPFEKRPMPIHPNTIPWNQTTPSVEVATASREYFEAPEGVAIEHFLGGRVGRTLYITATGEREILHDVDRIRLSGGVSWMMNPGDSLVLRMLQEGTWSETGRLQLP